MNKETEQKIFDAALEVFQKRGFATAKLSEIAQEADINQSLLHYYFRNKENLFKEVLRHKILELIDRVGKGFVGVELDSTTSTTAFSAIMPAIQAYHHFFADNPNLPMFIISEINTNPDIIKELFSHSEIAQFRNVLTKKMDSLNAMNQTSIPMEQLLLSFVGMLLFPFVGKEIFKLVFDYDDNKFNSVIDERQVILPQLFNQIM